MHNTVSRFPSSSEEVSSISNSRFKPPPSGSTGSRSLKVGRPPESPMKVMKKKIKIKKKTTFSNQSIEISEFESNIHD